MKDDPLFYIVLAFASILLLCFVGAICSLEADLRKRDAENAVLRTILHAEPMPVTITADF